MGTRVGSIPSPRFRFVMTHRTVRARRLALAAGLAFALPLAGASEAYSVGPLRQTLVPGGNDAIGELALENDGATPAALSLSVERASVAEDGTVGRVSGEDDFIVFPPQALLQPGASQKVQVRYIGPADIDAARLYLVTVEQVPVALDAADGAELSVGVNFVTVFNVEPQGATADVRLVSATSEAGGAVRLRIENAGTAMDRLERHALVADGARVPLDPAWLGETSIIEARAARDVLLPAGVLPAGADAGALALAPAAD